MRIINRPPEVYANVMKAFARPDNLEKLINNHSPKPHRRLMSSLAAIYHASLPKPPGSVRRGLARGKKVT